MIPKVIIWKNEDNEKLLGKLSLNSEKILSVDGEKINIEDFRHWVNNSIGIISSRPGYKLIVWNADNLSFECQAVLLKPLEELRNDLYFYLVVKNENGLMTTMLSRCTVEKIEDDVIKDNDGYWEKVMECWKSGPAKCIEFSDTIDKDKALVIVDELLEKMRNNLMTGVNEKRLLIMDEVLKFSQDVKQRNINIKLATGDFLLRTWRLIKLPA